MAYFRWILAYIDVLCQLFTFNIQKIDFWVQKWKNFEMLKRGMGLSPKVPTDAFKKYV